MGGILHAQRAPAKILRLTASLHLRVIVTVEIELKLKIDGREVPFNRLDLTPIQPSSSPPRRGAPQVGWKIKARTSLLTRFRPPAVLNFEIHVQYNETPPDASSQPFYL